RRGHRGRARHRGRAHAVRRCDRHRFRRSLIGGAYTERQLEDREGEVVLAQAAAVSGKVIGAACGAAAALAWSFAMWVPSAGLTLSGVSFLVAFAMALLALFG